MDAKKWAARYAANARFDYVKLRFNSAYDKRERIVREDVYRAVSDWLQSSGYGGLYMPPRFTVLPSSYSKPDGKLLVEFFGPTAAAVAYLDFKYAFYITYAHVKSFVESTRTMRGLSDIFIDQPGSRAVSLRRYNSQKNGKMAGVVISLGSAKSGIHISIYQRQNEYIGVECKFRDEQVTEQTYLLNQQYENSDFSSAMGWYLLLGRFAERAGSAVATEIYRRRLQDDVVPMFREDVTL